MFFAPRKPKTTVLTMFFASGSKNHSIYKVFWPAPSQNTDIYAVFTMLPDVISICEKDKRTLCYAVFASRAQQKIVKQLFQNARGLQSFEEK